MTPRDTSLLLLMLLFVVYGVTSRNQSLLSEKHPSCSVAPQWDICKYHYIQWQREYRWRAYYDSRSNDCYYYRGCPDTNKELFTYDVDCRKACVTGAESLKAGGKPTVCFQKPKLAKCEKMVKKFWFDVADLKCKTFFSCENSNQRYWKSKEACYAACSPQGKKASKGVANFGSRIMGVNRESPHLLYGGK